MKSVLAAWFALAVFVGCTDDEQAPMPPPRCSEIGAPSTLICNGGGLCDWNGQECCNPVRPGVAPDPTCEGVY